VAIKLLSKRDLWNENKKKKKKIKNLLQTLRLPGERPDIALVRNGGL
jgi:hypothetical protein